MIRNASKFADQDLLQKARGWFVDMLHASTIEQTRDTCVYGSHFLRMVLLKFANSATDIHIVAGGPPDNTGLKTGHQEFKAHMWVGMTVAGQLWYADITADQFGLPEVVVAPASDLNHLYFADPREKTLEFLKNLYRRDQVLSNMAGIN